MRKLFKLTAFMFIVTSSFLVFGSKAEAAIVSTSVSSSPTGSRAICNTGEPVDFNGYIDNVSLNTTTGVLSYRVVLGWQTCPGGAATRAYAIYGPEEICPVSGIYGVGGIVTDCVKYVGSPPYVGAGNGLACWGGTNSQCVTSAGGSVIRAEQQPSPLNLAFIPMTQTIPNWGVVSQSSGSFSTGNKRMCQFYKIGANFNTLIGDSRCIDMSIGASWTVQLGDDIGNCSVTVPGGTTVFPGQTVPVQYSMTNGGPRPWSVLSLNPGAYRLRNQNPAPWGGAPGDVYPNASATNIENNPTFGSILRQNTTTTWTDNLVIPSNILPPDAFSTTRTLNFVIFGNNNEQGDHTVGNSCPLTLNIQLPVERPYFRSYGGDVVVGRNFVKDGACSATQPVSSIKAFTRGAGTDWKGSGSEFAARATDVIEGFLSASMRTGAAPLAPNGLSFGNRTGVGSDQFAYTGCMPDYWSEYIQGKYPDQATLDDHNLNKPNNLGAPATSTGEWGGANITTSNSGYYFYDGDLTITGNVTLAGYSFDANSPTANLNEIPKFVLVVRGNINIAPNVTQLQGVFIAQENPDPSVTVPTGIINTCARTGVTWQQCVSAPKLEVQGSFIAKEVKLNRLRGDVDAAGVREGSTASEPAEVFIFRPDLLLSTAGDEQNPSTKITDYDSIVGLPPVL